MLTTEYVHVQKDDDFLNKLEYLVTNLINQVKRTGNSTNSTISSKEIYKNISTLLTDRFGIPFQLIYSSDAGLAIFPVSTSKYNYLRNFDAEELSKEFKDNVTNYKKKSEKNVDNFEKDMLNVFSRYVVQMDEVHNKLEKDGVFVDFNNARIENLNDIKPVIILISPKLLVDSKVEAKELMAGLLHEVGHQFYLLAEQFKSVAINSVLMNSLHETVNRRNRDILDGIHVAYEKAFNKKPNSKNIASGFIEIIQEYNKIHIGGKANTDTNFEELADMFPSRFGLGGELSSLLIKLGEDNNKKGYLGYFLDYLPSCFIISMVFTFYIIILTGQFGFIILGLIMTIVLSLIGVFFPDVSGVQLYPILGERLKKIKLDAIKQLKMIENTKQFNKDDIRAIVTRIEYIDVLENTIKNNTSGYIKKVFELGYSNEELSLRKFFGNLQELSENKLHYVNAKLKI